MKPRESEKTNSRSTTTTSSTAPEKENDTDIKLLEGIFAFHEVLSFKFNFDEIRNSFYTYKIILEELKGGCDIFLMSSETDAIKISDKHHLYLYKDNKEKIYYKIQDKAENQYLGLDLDKVLKDEKFDQLENNPIQCAKQEVCSIVLKETSKPGHTQINILSQFTNIVTRITKLLAYLKDLNKSVKIKLDENELNAVKAETNQSIKIKMASELNILSTQAIESFITTLHTILSNGKKGLSISGMAENGEQYFESNKFKNAIENELQALNDTIKNFQIISDNFYKVFYYLSKDQKKIILPYMKHPSVGLEIKELNDRLVELKSVYKNDVLKTNEEIIELENEVASLNTIMTLILNDLCSVQSFPSYQIISSEKSSKDRLINIENNMIVIKEQIASIDDIILADKVKELKQARNKITEQYEDPKTLPESDKQKYSLLEHQQDSLFSNTAHRNYLKLTPAEKQKYNNLEEEMEKILKNRVWDQNDKNAHDALEGQIKELVSTLKNLKDKVDDANKKLKTLTDKVTNFDNGSAYLELKELEIAFHNAKQAVFTSFKEEKISLKLFETLTQTTIAEYNEKIKSHPFRLMCLIEKLEQPKPVDPVKKEEKKDEKRKTRSSSSTPPTDVVYTSTSSKNKRKITTTMTEEEINDANKSSASSSTTSDSSKPTKRRAQSHATADNRKRSSSISTSKNEIEKNKYTVNNPLRLSLTKLGNPEERAFNESPGTPRRIKRSRSSPERASVSTMQESTRSTQHQTKLSRSNPNDIEIEKNKDQKRANALRLSFSKLRNQDEQEQGEPLGTPRRIKRSKSSPTKLSSSEETMIDPTKQETHLSRSNPTKKSGDKEKEEVKEVETSSQPTTSTSSNHAALFSPSSRRRALTRGTKVSPHSTTQSENEKSGTRSKPSPGRNDDD